MIIQLDPRKWFGGGAVSNPPAAAIGVATDARASVRAEIDAAKGAAKENAMNKFVGTLEAIGKGFLKGLNWALAYAVPAEKLTALLFPETQAVMPEVIDATLLVRNSVMLVEQKYAAAGKQSGSGKEKQADVLALVGPTVATLLKRAGVQADDVYVQNIVSAVVAVLDVQQAPAAATAA